jgi:hypothetical protein
VSQWNFELKLDAQGVIRRRRGWNLESSLSAPYHRDGFVRATVRRAASDCPNLCLRGSPSRKDEPRVELKRDIVVL